MIRLQTILEWWQHQNATEKIGEEEYNEKISKIKEDIINLKESIKSPSKVVLIENDEFKEGSDFIPLQTTIEKKRENYSR